MVGPASTGKWVRTHDKKSAELYMTEQKMNAEARQERARRSRQFRRDLWQRLRGLWSRSSS